MYAIFRVVVGVDEVGIEVEVVVEVDVVGSMCITVLLPAFRFSNTAIITSMTRTPAYVAIFFTHFQRILPFFFHFLGMLPKMSTNANYT